MSESLVGCWIQLIQKVKDMFLFPETTESFSSVKTAKVLRAITAEEAGRIRFQGTDWPARLNHPETQAPLPPSTKVHVVGRQGITLLVEPVQ